MVITIRLLSIGEDSCLVERRLFFTANSSSTRCSRKSVSLILQKQRLTGSVADLQIPGRSLKTSSKEDRLIVRKSKSDRFKTALQIRAEDKVQYGINVSISTAQRRLRETGPCLSTDRFAMSMALPLICRETLLSISHD